MNGEITVSNAEKQAKEDRTRTKEIEEQKKKSENRQAPEDKQRTDVIEELKRKQGKS